MGASRQSFPLTPKQKSMANVRSLVRRSYRLSMLPRDWLIRQALAWVEAPEARRFASVLELLERRDAREQTGAIAAIEQERRRLASNTDLLADGSLGEAGIYDAKMSIADACKASKPASPALLMHLLVREFAPKQLVELGTNLGISSAYEATALRANGFGALATFESSPYRLRVAKQVHTGLDLNNISYFQGLFSETLAVALKDLPPVDFAFIDGHHQYQPTLDYCELMLRHAAPELIVVFDDIRWSDGMKRAWRVLKKDARFQFVVDLHGVGICMRVPRTVARRYVFPALHHTFS